MIETLAPRPVFFRGGIPLALAIPPVSRIPDWALALCIVGLLAIGLRMLDNLPVKQQKWAGRALGFMAVAALLVFCWRWEWVMWVTISQVVLVIIWNLILWNRPRDDD